VCEKTRGSFFLIWVSLKENECCLKEAIRDVKRRGLIDCFSILYYTSRLSTTFVINSVSSEVEDVKKQVFASVLDKTTHYTEHELFFDALQMSTGSICNLST
jgi:hypothetical protein